MDKRELRIGNKALLGDSIVTIEEICSDGIETPEHGFVSESQLRGIPLDSSWLERAGWCYYNGQARGEMTMDTNCKLDIDSINEKIQVKSHYEAAFAYRPIQNCQFVHQLQNLYFALTGTEITFKP